jgi:predicted phosphodiesterase
MAEARFLAAADLHLGRPIASLPEALRGEAHTLGPLGALERIVDLALQERVDAVLLAGDVVDDDGAYFEVFSAIQSATARLDGIPIIAVAGNHDAAVLPKLAEAIDGLTLIGAGGRWQSVDLPTAAGTVQVLGWSFPQSHHRDSPFQTPPPRADGPRIGLLHGDLDTTSSVYAPFTRAELREHAADAWLLGHVHVPSSGGLAMDRPAGYLGSACGLDPSESGPRGAWVVTLDGSGVALDHRPLAPIAWAHRAIEGDQLDPSTLEDTLFRLASDACERADGAEAVGVRFTLRGTHEQWRAIAGRAESLDLGRPWSVGARRVFIERVRCDLSAPFDLHALAQERSVAGRIAALILELEAGEGGAIVAQAEAAFGNVAAERPFRMPSLGESALPAPEAKGLLVREARDLLGRLVAQRDGERC